MSLIRDRLEGTWMDISIMTASSWSCHGAGFFGKTFKSVASLSVFHQSRLVRWRCQVFRMTKRAVILAFEPLFQARIYMEDMFTRKVSYTITFFKISQTNHTFLMHRSFFVVASLQCSRYPFSRDSRPTSDLTTITSSCTLVQFFEKNLLILLFAPAKNQTTEVH